VLLLSHGRFEFVLAYFLHFGILQVYLIPCLGVDEAHRTPTPESGCAPAGFCAAAVGSNPVCFTAHMIFSPLNLLLIRTLLSDYFQECPFSEVIP
jgi:hypothetical protein